MKVFVVGSCRVWRPLRRMQELGQVALTNHVDPWWFTHSARAAVQFLTVTLGDGSIPPDLQPLIVETHPPARRVSFHGGEAFAQAQALVVEVSSLRCNLARDWDLNRNLIVEQPKRAAGLEMLRTFEVSEVIFNRDLRRIKRFAAGRPIVFVDAIHWVDPRGTVPMRVRLSQYLARGVAEIGETVLHTEQILQGHDPAQTLNSRDHYAQAFEPVVGAAILDALRGRLVAE